MICEVFNKRITKISRSEWLNQSAQDASQWNMPHVTRNHHPTDTHEERHEYVDGIVVQKSQTALDSAAWLVTFLVVGRIARTRHQHLFSSCVNSVGHLISNKVVSKREKKGKTYFLPAAALNHLARPSVNHTSLEPTPQGAVEDASEASPYGDSNDPEDPLLPSPATATLQPRLVAEDFTSDGGIGRAERDEDHRRQRNNEATRKPR